MNKSEHIRSRHSVRKMLPFFFVIAIISSRPTLAEGNSLCNISLSTEKQFVELNTRVAMKCQSCLASISMYIYHNGAYIADFEGSDASVVNITLYQLSGKRFQNGSTVLELIILNFTIRNIGTYTCFQGNLTYSSSVNILNTVPVNNVTLTPSVSTLVVIADVTNNVTRCVSSVGRPPPVITWYMDNKTPFNFNDDLNLTGNSISTTENYVTTSTLTFTPNDADHGARIYCNSSNGYGQVISDRTPEIDVLRFPSKPIIIYKTVIVNTISVIQNTTVSLECNCSGNPTPNITWIFSNGSELNKRTLNLELKQRETTNSVTCKAASVLQPTNGSPIRRNTTSGFLITILYPPSNPLCTIGNNPVTLNTIRAVRNESLTIDCNSESNPPPMSYTWTLSGGTKHVGPQLVIPRVQSSDTYTFEVINEMNETFAQSVTGRANATLRLDVLFPVVVLHIENATVLVNKNLSVSCLYTPGNPSKTSFSWIHVNTSRVVGTMQTLVLPRMNLSDEGFYKCRVNNTMEPTGCCANTSYDETMFYVDVQYAANITRFYADGRENAQQITVNENQTVILHCDSIGDPLAYMLFTNNTRGENDLLRGTYNNTISASIPHARCEFDMGVYQCKASNTHNAVQMVREVEILIKCGPRSSPFKPPVPNIWTKTNSSVILTYTIVAYPPPSNSSAFVWRKQVNDKSILLNDSRRLHIDISDDRMQTNLSILQVQEEDFAHYTVNVKTEMGFTEHTFVIQANEKPAIPQQFRVPEETITDNSVIVEWKPGLNGGEDQWFVIGFKQKADKNWTYKTVFETRTSIEGLVSGTAYQFKMHAENSIGKSEETIFITLTTRAKPDNGSSPSVGASVGGAVGGTLLAALLVVLWKYRNKFKRNPDAGAHYDDLFRGQINVSAVNTSSEYAEYKDGSQHRNQYETLAETEFREYSVLSTSGTEGNRVLNLVSGVSDNNCAVKTDDNVYVNLVLSKTET